jgi:hypothetical protein
VKKPIRVSQKKGASCSVKKMCRHSGGIKNTHILYFHHFYNIRHGMTSTATDEKRAISTLRRLNNTRSGIASRVGGGKAIAHSEINSTALAEFLMEARAQKRDAALCSMRQWSNATKRRDIDMWDNVWMQYYTGTMSPLEPEDAWRMYTHTLAQWALLCMLFGDDEPVEMELAITPTLQAIAFWLGFKRSDGSKPQPCERIVPAPALRGTLTVEMINSSIPPCLPLREEGEIVDGRHDGMSSPIPGSTLPSCAAPAVPAPTVSAPPAELCVNVCAEITFARDDSWHVLVEKERIDDNYLSMVEAFVGMMTRRVRSGIMYLPRSRLSAVQEVLRWFPLKELEALVWLCKYEADEAEQRLARLAQRPEKKRRCDDVDDGNDTDTDSSEDSVDAADAHALTKSHDGGEDADYVPFIPEVTVYELLLPLIQAVQLEWKCCTCIACRSGKVLAQRAGDCCRSYVYV